MSLSISQARARAIECHPTDHFEIRYSLRDAKVGGATQYNGVRSSTLIKVYAEALEDAWRDLFSLDAQLIQPAIASLGKIQCLVTAIPEPLCYPEVADGEIHPLIVLPSCYPELADWPAVIDMARCAARHEPAHAWAYRVWRERWSTLNAMEARTSILRLLAPRALWLLEGHAVAIEAGAVSEGYWLQHAWSWCDRPELSLFNEPYAAGFFARYLDRRLGLKPGEVFSRAISAITEPVSTLGISDDLTNAPRLVWQALHRVLQPNLTAEDAWLDACRAGAFIGDSAHPADEELAVFRRYSRRAVTEEFTLQSGQTTTSRPFFGSSLSCRYFSLSLHPSVQSIELDVIRLSQAASPKLRVGLWSETNAAVGAWLPLGQTEWLLPNNATDPTENTRWRVVCALVPDDSGGESESTLPMSWTLRLRSE